MKEVVCIVRMLMSEDDKTQVKQLKMKSKKQTILGSVCMDVRLGVGSQIQFQSRKETSEKIAVEVLGGK